MAEGEVFKCACDEILAFAKKVGANVIVGQSLEVLFLDVRLPTAWELVLFQ